MTYIVVSLSLFVYSILIFYSNIILIIIVYCLFIRFSDTGVPVPHIFPLNFALFHGQPEVLRDLRPRVDGHLMVLVVSCRHLVQVCVLANFLRQTLFQVVHSPNLKTQKTRRLLKMAVFEWKPEKRSPADVVSRPITANAAALVFALPQRMSRIFGRCTSGPCGGRKGGPQGCNGSVSPLALCQHGSITQALELPFWRATILLVFTLTLTPVRI